MGRSTGSVVAAAVLVTSLASFGCKPDASTPPSSAQAPSVAPTTAGPSQATPTAATMPLARGDVAPAFALPGSDGTTHALADDAGKNVVVVAWFPKAFTGG